MSEKPDEKIYQWVSGKKSQHFKLLDIYKEITTHLYYIESIPMDKNQDFLLAACYE
jgi:hypothetical protein